MVRTHHPYQFRLFLIAAFLLLCMFSPCLAVEPAVQRADQQGWIHAIAFSPDGDLIAAGHENGDIELVMADKGKVDYVLRSKHDAVIHAVAFSPDGKLLATTGDDRSIWVWDVATKAHLYSLVAHEWSVRAVAFSPDGKTLLTGCEDGKAIFWDIASKTPTASLDAHQGVIRSVAFCPGGKIAATAGLDNCVRIWDVATHQEIGTLHGHQAGEALMAFSPDGKSLATVGTILDAKGDSPYPGLSIRTIVGGEVRLWDVTTGKERLTFRGHTGSCITCISFSPTGNLIATGDRDNRVTVWDATSGNELVTLADGVQEVFALAFSADGKWLAAANNVKKDTLKSGEVRYWNVSSIRDANLGKIEK